MQLTNQNARCIYGSLHWPIGDTLIHCGCLLTITQNGDRFNKFLPIEWLKTPAYMEGVRCQNSRHVNCSFWKCEPVCLYFWLYSCTANVMPLNLILNWRHSLFSSPCTKCRWAFRMANQMASVVRCPSTFYSDDIFYNTTWPILMKLDRNTHCMKLYQECSKNAIPC
jgi:hypothetical protein